VGANYSFHENLHGTTGSCTVAHSFHHHHLFHDMFHDSDKECRQACVQQQRASISPRKDRRVTPRQPRPAALRTLLLAVRLYSGR
jgi:hypothetical protein